MKSALHAALVLFLTAPALADAWFDRPVDFWSGPQQAPPPTPTPQPLTEPKPAPERVESIWAEPTQLPDGRWVIYMPPPIVLQHLDAPTRETARAYLKWQQERLDRIAKATELIQEVAAEEQAPAKTEAAPQAAAAAQEPTARYRLLYFTSPGCSHCQRQDPLVADLTAKHPGLSLTRVDLADPAQRELAKQFGVTHTPTLIFLDTESKRASRADGYTSAEDLAAHVAALMDGQP